MAFESVPINTGTAAPILVDQSGTAFAQVVKIVQGADGVFDALASTLAISGTVSGSVSISGTGNVTIAGTPTVTASQGGTWNIATISTLLGTIAVSGGGGAQYTVDSTALGATGTGTLILGMQTGATTGRGIAVTTTGAQIISFVTTQAVTAANVTVASVTTGTMNVVNVLSASGVTIASIATGTVSIVGTPAVTAANVTIASVTTGTMTIVGTPVYTIDSTNQSSTAGAIVMAGIQATTARALTLSVTGDPGARQVGVWNVATITTLLGTVAVSGGGGGVQYSINDTSMAATGTGNLVLGMQTGATTGRGLAVTTTGALLTAFVTTQAVTAANVTIASITTGTMNVINVLSASGVTIASVTTGTMNVVNVLSAADVTIASIATGTVGLGTAQYGVNSTNLGTTGQGVLVMGMQTGATTGRGIAVSTTGGLIIASMPAVGGGQQYSVGDTSMGATATGTIWLGVQTGATTGRGIAVTTTGQAVVAWGQRLDATNDTVACITTGHSSRWDAYAVNTTSGASVIVKTSGAHTLYITDMILSVDVPSRVDIYSAATTKLSLYLATKGGFTVSLTQPMVLNSAQSLTFTPSASGSSMIWAQGYTVT